MIVACGGIGTPQLLLQPRADGGVPIGNESGLAGKFLMEHPTFVEAGECVLSTDLDALPRPSGFGNAVHALVPDAGLMDRYGLRSCAVDCQHQTTDHVMVRYLSQKGGQPFYHYRCTVRTEMLPSASNCVYLTGERDRAGFYTPAVRCVIDADDFLNAETTLRLLGQSLVDQGRGGSGRSTARFIGNSPAAGTSWARPAWARARQTRSSIAIAACTDTAICTSRVPRSSPRPDTPIRR